MISASIIIILPVQQQQTCAGLDALILHEVFFSPRATGGLTIVGGNTIASRSMLYTVKNNGGILTEVSGSSLAGQFIFIR